MSPERFEELLGRLLDGELSPVDGDELAAVLRAEPDRRRECRQHLVLWELWSQQQAPERSAEAFVAAFRTRMHAERQSESFVDSLKKRIARDAGGAGTESRLGAWWAALRRPAGLAWASSVAVVALVFFVWLLAPHRAEAMTIVHGEAVCPLCVLHEGHVHRPALRVNEGGVARVIDLDPSDQLAQMQGYFCSGPNPLTVEGRPHTEAGRTSFNVSRIELPPPSPKSSDDQRSIFPL